MNTAAITSRLFPTEQRSKPARLDGNVAGGSVAVHVDAIGILYELVFWKAQVVCPVELSERVLVRSCTINHAAVLIAWMSCHQGKKLELRIRCRSMQRSISSDRGPADEPIRRRISRSVSRHRASMIASTIQRRRLRRLRLADGAVASIEFFFPCERIRIWEVNK